MSGLRDAQDFRARPSRPAPASLALLVLALAAPAGAPAADDARAPDLGDCQELRVESGNKVSAYLYGVGTQNYQWNGERWVFIGPEAVLFADIGHHAAVGVHFGSPIGPTWVSESGSLVVGLVMDRCPADPASIPWVLLARVYSEGPGLFDRVTYIQRLNTVGGNAPSVPGDFPGQGVKVPYSANYVFYRKSH